MGCGVDLLFHGTSPCWELSGGRAKTGMCFFCLGDAERVMRHKVYFNESYGNPSVISAFSRIGIELMGDLGLRSSYINNGAGADGRSGAGSGHFGLGPASFPYHLPYIFESHIFIGEQRSGKHGIGGLLVSSRSMKLQKLIKNFLYLYMNS